MLNEKEILKIAVEALDGKNGKDIKVLKISDVSTLADYFVICTASSANHVKTLSDVVESKLTERGEEPLRREGARSDLWVLLDYSCVVVHIFMPESRDFYKLERLWADAKEIDIADII